MDAYDNPDIDPCPYCNLAARICRCYDPSYPDRAAEDAYQAALEDLDGWALDDGDAREDCERLAAADLQEA